MLIGHLGVDPEVRHLDNNSVVANFRLATTESYKTREGDWKEQTEWHNVVMWRRLAEIAENYLRKGSLVYIEGKLQTRSWEDRDGNKRYTTEVVASNMQMLDKKGDDGGGTRSSGGGYSERSAAPEPSGGSDELDEPEDDLPF